MRDDRSLIRRLLDACAADGSLDESIGRKIIDDYVAERASEGESNQ